MFKTEELAGALGYKVGHLFISYLSLPIGADYCSKALWEPMVECFEGSWHLTRETSCKPAIEKIQEERVIERKMKMNREEEGIHDRLGQSYESSIALHMVGVYLYTYLNSYTPMTLYTNPNTV